MSQGKEYAVALLARGTIGDWGKMSRDQQENIAMDIFDAVDKDGSGSVDRSELFDFLAHGSVSTPLTYHHITPFYGYKGRHSKKVDIDTGISILLLCLYIYIYIYIYIYV